MLWNAINGSVAIGNTDMCYVSFGYGDKSLVLLPGLSDGLTTVKNKALLLALPYRRFFNDYTVYIFSRNNSLPDGCTIREMADNQAEAMRKLGLASASVLGASQGGMIAQYLAIDYPELVDKLILAVTAPYANESVNSTLNDWIALAKNNNHRQLMIDTAEKSYSESYLRKYRRLLPLLGALSKPKDYYRFLVNAQAILTFNASAELHRISCPTLIIAGQLDKIVGVKASYEMHDTIAGSELYIYPEFGHAAYEEAKDFNQRLLDFLRKA